MADAKLDGIRVQVHRDGDEIAVFSRSLDDITARVPGVVAVARDLPARAAVLDGEALGVDPGGRPLPFQETSSRAARRDGALPVRPYFFDLLHLDGDDLLDAPLTERWAALAAGGPGVRAGGSRRGRRRRGGRRGLALGAGRRATRAWSSRRRPRPTTSAGAAPRG